MDNPKILKMEMTRAQLLAIDAIKQSLANIQDVLSFMQGLDSVEFVACIGVAMGDVIGCVDARFEKDRELSEECKESYKQVILLNFNSQYNIHRSLHERPECCPKPEPKIV